MLGLTSLVLLSWTAHAQELVPAGERLENALHAQVTEDGLDEIEIIARTLVPELIPTDLFDVGDIELDLGITTFSLTGLRPTIDIGAVDLRPENGKLVIEATALIGVNDVNEPFRLDYFLCDSDAYILPFPATLVIDLRLAVVNRMDGTRGFDVTVDLVSIETDLEAGDFQFIQGGFGCSLTSSLISIVDQAVVSFLTPEIQTAISDLEPTLEEALEAAVIEESFEVLDATLDVKLEPRQVNIVRDQGLELVYSATVSAGAVATCIMEDDPGGSLLTASPAPDLASLPSGQLVAAHVSDELVNQALYAAYQSGLLCFTLDEDAGIDLPITLDSSVLSLFGGDGYDEILGEEPKPLLIQTLPLEVPTSYFDGDADIGVSVRRLQIGMFTEVDYRMARGVGLEVDVDADVDLRFDGITGELGIDLVLNKPSGGEGLELRVVPDVLVKGSEQGFVDGVSGLVDTLIGSLLGDLLGGPLLTLPSFQGLGLTYLDAYPSGAQSDWLTADAGLGVVGYGDAGAGCDSEGGCGGCDSGCDSGTSCSSAGLNVGGWLAFLGPLWLLRRRQPRRA